jgi:hypothetical protein
MDTKPTRISNYSFEEIKKIGDSIGSPNWDTTLRHMIDNYKCKNIIDDYMKPSQSEIITRECTLRAVNIVANAKMHMALKQNFDQDFAELLREISILKTYTPHNITEGEAVIRFFEIMSMKPGSITKNLMEEVINLFDEVIPEIGSFD